LYLNSFTIKEKWTYLQRETTLCL